MTLRQFFFRVESSWILLYVHSQAPPITIAFLPDALIYYDHSFSILSSNQGTLENTSKLPNLSNDRPHIWNIKQFFSHPDVGKSDSLISQTTPSLRFSLCPHLLNPSSNIQNLFGINQSTHMQTLHALVSLASGLFSSSLLRPFINCTTYKHQIRWQVRSFATPLP